MMLSCVVGLLLLLGCLPCADAVDEVGSNEIPQQLVNRAERICQDTCHDDIHAALREMTALLTEQRVLLQATVDRLKASESVIEEQHVELQQTQQELKALRDSGNLMKAYLEYVDARSNATENEVQFLQKQHEVEQVAFSASLLASGTGNTGPYNVETILTYRQVITNVGNGYNPHTGFFTAPVRGLYQFTFFVHGFGNDRAAAAFLFKNSQRVVTAYGSQAHFLTSSNGASLVLAAGDVVYVKLYPNAWIYDDPGRYSTFSGHLLFTL